jgi:hypothetical protein
MRSIIQILVLAGAWSVAGLAQVWEVGGAGGAGFVRGLNVTGPAGTATTGFQPGWAVGAVAGQTFYPRLSGELRYTYQRSALKLSSGGSETTFGGDAHAIHYDLLWHFRTDRPTVRPFVAGGAGIKLFRGIGKEAAYQPLNQFAYLTHTQQVEPLISAGGGVEIALKPTVRLRIEFRDYVTPFPDQVIAAAPGMHIHGWLHDIVPLVGISYVFAE